MNKLLVPTALAVTLLGCGSTSREDGGTDGGHDGGANDAGDDGGTDGGCDCAGMCPQVDCFPFQDADGGTVCQCAI